MSSFPNGTFSVTATAASLFAPNPDFMLKNNGPFSVFIGGSSVTADVTSTGGYQLHPGETFSFTGGNGIYNLWAVTAAGTSYLSYLSN